VKLSEIRVGEHYAVHLDHKTNYQDADREGYWFGDHNYPELPGAFALPYYAKVKVLAIGVPYRKGLQGVRIEYRYLRARRLPREVGYGLETDPATGEIIEDEHTNRVTVHCSILIAQWDEHELRRAIRRHEQQERLKQRRQEP
jgi:hypothetical protein